MSRQGAFNFKGKKLKLNTYLTYMNRTIIINGNYNMKAGT